MGTINIQSTDASHKASLTFTGTSDVSVDATNLSGLTGNVQTQLNTKQELLISGTNIKTINGSSLLFAGDITVGNLSDTAHLFSGNGYQKLSNGLIIQWGYGNGTVTFPIAFPNQGFSVMASKDASFDNYATVYGLSKTSCVIRNGNAWWFAIGY